MTIWKFDLPVNVTTIGAEWKERFDLEMPGGESAKPLSVGVQFGRPVVWVLVDESKSVLPKRFAIVGTGKPATSTDSFIGTIELLRGGIILHVFETGGI